MSLPSRALVVIDVQNEYVDGGLIIEHPPVAQSLANIGRAMDAARDAGIPVVVVQNFAPPASPLFARGKGGAELHDVVASRPRDHFLEKGLPSAFADTDLAGWLDARAIDTVTLAGFMTHNCIDSTAKHALHAGLKVEFLQDASGSVSYANRAGFATAEQIHRAFAVVLQSRFAAVLDTRDWIDLLKTGVQPERDTIYQSHLRGVARALPLRAPVTSQAISSADR